jgi:hypothetical protein
VDTDTDAGPRPNSSNLRSMRNKDLKANELPSGNVELDHTVLFSNTNTVMAFMYNQAQTVAIAQYHWDSRMYPQPCEQVRPLRNASIWHFIERSSQRRQAQSEKLLFDFLLDCIGDVPEDMVGTLGGEKQDIICLPLVDPATGPMKGVLSWIKLARDVSLRAR